MRQSSGAKKVGNSDSLQNSGTINNKSGNSGKYGRISGDATEITISLPEQYLSLLEFERLNRDIPDRATAVAEIMKEYLISHRATKAVVLAGGLGTRLRPFTYEVPKPLVPVQGRPLTDISMDILRRAGVKDAWLCLGYKAEQIEKGLGYGSTWGMRLHYVVEKDALGTAGPLNQIRDELDTTFIMLNGDILTDLDVLKMMKYHIEKQAVATIALYEVDDPSRFGVARLTEEGRIVEFIEKPAKDKAPSRLINAGVYILEPEVVGYVKEGFCMMEKEVFPVLAKEGKLYGYPFTGQWFDTGTMESYERAIKEWKMIEKMIEP